MNDLFLLASLLVGPQHGYALKKQVGLISGQGEMHNNLVYPLLRRFVARGWVNKRKAPGKRGQTREVYALTSKGKQALLLRLSQFTGKEVSAENGFRLRVGMFHFLDTEASGRILAQREEWLAAREQHLARLSDSLDLGVWGGEVVRFLRDQIRAERGWISRLKRKLGRQGAGS
ncbi:MAG TPA: PadR family transcriptional regulator [Terriglobales bacterium]|nr:PadR family transcriptional regulator [Terriglobales bacterium]